MNITDSVFALLARGQLSGPLDRVLVTDHETFRLYGARELMLAARVSTTLEGEGPVAAARPVSIGARVLIGGVPWIVGSLGREVALLVQATAARIATEGLARLPIPIEDFWRQVADGAIVPVDPAGDEIPPWAQALLVDTEDFTVAGERVRIVLAYRARPRRRNGGVPAPRNQFMGHPLRTVQEWQRRYLEAERKPPHLGILGLVDGPNPGNRTGNLADLVLRVCNAVIDEEFLATGRAPHPTRAHGEVLRRLRELGSEAKVSFAAFMHLLDQRSLVDVVEAREGHRAAYPLTDQFYAGTSPFPVHGLYPWHVVHCDSTILPIELRDLAGRSLGKPWLHLAIDAYTRRVLAAVLTFEPPSHRSTCLLVDEMVMRFRRVPDFLTHDQGKEYENAHVRLVCAALGISDKVRPAAKPRYGSIIERLLGSLQTWLIDNLSGTAKIEKDHFRQVTKAVDPVRHRTWDLLSLHYAIQGVAYDLYDGRVHPTTLESPRERYARGMEVSGSRPMRTIPYDETLRMTLLPLASRGGERFVDPQKGVKIGEIHYRHPLFGRHPVFRRTGAMRRPCRVKPDPYDARRVFVYVPVPHPDRPYGRGHWVIATASPEGLGRVGRLTRRQLAIETAVFRRRRQLQHAGDEDFEVALAAFIKEREAYMHRVIGAARAEAERSVRDRAPAHPDPAALEHAGHQQRTAPASARPVAPVARSARGADTGRGRDGAALVDWTL